MVEDSKLVEGCDVSIADLFDADESDTESINNVDVELQTNTDEDEYDSDEQDEAPSYLMSAILAGLYELPPTHILKHQTGWGRRIRYDKNFIKRVKNNFIHQQYVETELYGKKINFEVLKMNMRRFFYHEKSIEAVSSSDFFIYKARLDHNLAESLNRPLSELVWNIFNHDKVGLDVSNAGGTYHSHPDFFVKFDKENALFSDDGENARVMLSEICKKIVELINQLENPIDSCVEQSSNDLNLDNKNIEAWFNISNSDGCWNRLHTHEGSAWSGVYYVSNTSHNQQTYHSRLVLKPTPHPKEDNYVMTRAERNRLRNFTAKQHFHNGDPIWSEGSATTNGCHYVDIDPKPGDLVIFPSWLHHCVLPSKIKLNSKPRISVAFNINFLRKARE